MTILPQNKSSDFTVEKLLQHKILELLPQEKVNELQRLERFDVSGFTEADIREVIIAPLLRVLGYEKNSYFSIDHEKAIRIRGRSKFLDYGVSLFSENFWVIEAKKPKNSRKNFGPNDILQGLGYAAHPDINAALIVFCDGRILEIFDREANLETPIISAAICNLSQHINDIRALLGPWQYWFYQRRRVVRLAEKVIASETSLERANELVEQIQTIIHEKRSSILKNYRARTNFSEERGKWIEYLREADPREIIDVWFFRRHASLGELNAMAENLVKRCEQGNSRFLFSLFPDEIRDANSSFWIASLCFLVRLEEKRKLMVFCLVGWGPQRGNVFLLVMQSRL